MNSKPGTYTLKIINSAGQVVREMIRESATGTLVEQLDLTREPKGIYHLLVSSPDGEWKEKLTLQ
jgi:putative ubiquitin-RnfH superfamily antitoxin RatB of RatAB toxin-antitoxin module